MHPVIQGKRRQKENNYCCTGTELPPASRTSCTRRPAGSNCKSRRLLQAAKKMPLWVSAQAPTHFEPRQACWRAHLCTVVKPSLYLCTQERFRNRHDSSDWKEQRSWQDCGESRNPGTSQTSPLQPRHSSSRQISWSAVQTTILKTSLPGGKALGAASSETLCTGPEWCCKWSNKLAWPVQKLETRCLFSFANQLTQSFRALHPSLAAVDTSFALNFDAEDQGTSVLRNWRQDDGPKTCRLPVPLQTTYSF